jgi:hypothetical protein
MFAMFGFLSCAAMPCCVALSPFCVHLYCRLCLRFAFSRALFCPFCRVHRVRASSVAARSFTAPSHKLTWSARRDPTSAGRGPTSGARFYGTKSQAHLVVSSAPDERWSGPDERAALGCSVQRRGRDARVFCFVCFVFRNMFRDVQLSVMRCDAVSRYLRFAMAFAFAMLR